MNHARHYLETIDAMRGGDTSGCGGAPRCGALLLAVSITCLLSVGCWRSEPSTSDLPSGAVDQKLPAVPESLDDIRAQMARLVSVEDGKHRVTSPEEFDQWRLKALIKLDEIRRREGIAGFDQAPVPKTGSQQAVVDGSTGQIAWRAFTCWNPECLGKGKGGGPVAFVMQWEHASIGPAGKVVWRTLSEKELPPAITCSVCGLSDFIRFYDEPAVEIRRQKLTEELAKSRQTRAAAEAAGRLVPAGVRTPSEIMRELNELPKLFLLPKS